MAEFHSQAAADFITVFGMQMGELALDFERAADAVIAEFAEHLESRPPQATTGPANDGNV